MSNVENGFNQPQRDNDNAPFIAGKLVQTKIGYSIAAGGANVCEVTITLQDGHGTVVAEATPLTVWLSDTATGTGLTATSASGTVQTKSASGADFAVLTAKKALVAQPLATGVYILEITDSAKTGFYVAAQLPFGGVPAVSRQLVTGDYGA